MDTVPDLGSLSDQELKDLIQQLTDEEMEISYKRRILHARSTSSVRSWSTGCGAGTRRGRT